MERVLDDFLLAFVALLSIINPVGLVFVFREMTVWAAASERKALSSRIAVYALAAMMVAVVLQVEGSKIAEILYYPIAGLAWLPPAMWLVKWMQHPDVLPPDAGARDARS